MLAWADGSPHELMLGYPTRRVSFVCGEDFMTPLRRRFVDDLRLRNYSPRTIETYVAGVARLAKHFGRSPDQLGTEEVRAFQLPLVGLRVSWSLFNQTVCALRFLYGVTLGRPEQVPFIPYGKWPKTLPCVLSSAALRAAGAARPRRTLGVVPALAVAGHGRDPVVRRRRRG